MTKNFKLDFIWIPQTLGGHTGDPWDGMRLMIRWQEYIRDHLECGRDVQCFIDAYDPETRMGLATCRFGSDLPVPAAWIEDGALVELLDGYRVIAVGRVRGADGGA